jgi:hypothetical protein
MLGLTFGRSVSATAAGCPRITNAAGVGIDIGPLDESESSHGLGYGGLLGICRKACEHRAVIDEDAPADNPPR